MSYAGVYGADETCKHDHYYRNCHECSVEALEARGKRDSSGVLHADNGAGWCVGHIEKDPRWPNGDGRCTVLVRHCPVLNTPEQVQANRLEDHRAELTQARRDVDDADKNLAEARHRYRQLRERGPRG